MRAQNPNRWLIAGAAAMVMLTIGAIYSWAIFTQPLLVAYGWDLTTTTWTYAIANFSLAAVGAVIGGFWQDKVGPRTVAIVGVALWGCGNVCAGLGTSAFGAPWLYVSYGVIGGFGAGMAYVTPVSMVTRWFPDKKGLAGGLVVGGFGLGAFVYNQWIPRLHSFHAAATHAGGFLAARTAARAAGMTFDPTKLTVAQTFTADDIAAVMHVFIASGVVFLIVGLTAASLFCNPPPGYSPTGQRRTAISSANGGYSPSQALATPQFYLLWLQLFVNVIAGITIISNAVYILTDLTKLSAAAIAPLFGLVSIFNALGRVLWGAISDRIGCNHTFAALFAVQAVTLLLLANVHDLMPALAAVAVILLCCGGGFGTMPSFNAACLGTKFMGLNYGLILSAWGCAGLIGPIVAARAKDMTGSFAGMLPLVAFVLMMSVILPFITKKPARTLHAVTSVAPSRFRLAGARNLGPALAVVVVTLACSQLLLTTALAKTLAAGAGLATGYARLPLAFEQNRGQTDSEVRFLARGAGYALFLTPSETVLKFGPAQTADRDSGVLRILLVGGSSNATIAGEALLPGHSNYFLGNDQSKWRTQVEQFAKVRYREVYPGIDLLYYGNQRQLEYDFVVAPGADPDAIRMAYQGAQRLSIDTHGDLRIKTASGEIIQRKPLVYQAINGQMRRVSGRFLLRRDGSARQVSFRLAAYDRRMPLVIDPVLMYSTFLGGTGEDAVYGIAVDPSASVTVVGNTQSVDFPTHAALRATNSNQTDAFVTKFNPAGNALVYSTYLGTLASCPPAPCPITQATAVAVDGTGNAYITGRTQAPDFPTHDAFQPTFGGGGFDIFVTKLSSDGSALVYSTYLGGNETDQATGIAVDAAGSAYVTGCNELGNFPTLNPYQSTNRANATCTGILTKFTPSGSGLVYSTYFGGTGEDTPFAIAVDSSGDAYIAGATTSTDLPTKNPVQSTTQGVIGTTGFVTEFNPAGSALVYSTYLGGSNAGQVNAIAVDGNDNTYVVGFTQATDFPTQNAFLATNTGDGFVSALAPGGTSFIYSTYFPAVLTAVALDSRGDAYFAGANTPAVPLPTQNPIQATSHVARNNTVGTNAIVAEFNPAGSALLFSSYLGGSDSDIANTIAVDANENIYIAGAASSPDFPTLNALQPSNAGAGDGFIAKISPLTLNVAPSSIVSGQSAALTWSAGKAASCTGSGAWSGAEAINGSQAVSPTAVGTYLYTLTCVDTANISVSVSVTLTVTANSNPPPTVTIGVNPTSIVAGKSATLTWSSAHATTCTASGTWSGSEAVSGTLSVSLNSAGVGTYTLMCTNASGSVSASATLTVTDAPPAATVTIGVSPTSIVAGQSATLTWSSTHATACTAGGAWSGSEAVSGTMSVSPGAAGLNTYTLNCSGSGGSGNASAALTVTAMAAPGHSSGGGGLDLLNLLGLGFLGVLRAGRSARSTAADHPHRHSRSAT